MEDTRKRLDLHLTTRAKSAKKLIARSTFKRFDIINEDLTVIDLQKNEVLMDKPLNVGLCILELSKLTMYHYKEMIEEYGNRVKLAYTDTDSFIYKIETENLSNDLALNLDAYDTSDYPPDHPLNSRTCQSPLKSSRTNVLLSLSKNLSDFEVKCILFFSPAAKLNLQPREFHGIKC